MFLGIYLPNWLENLCPHNDLHVIFYGGFIHNHQKLNIIKMSFNRWGQTVEIHTMDYYSLIKSKKRLHTVCSKCMTFWKGNTIQMVKRLVVARGLGRERAGWKSEAQETSQGSETILQDAVMDNMTPCACQNNSTTQRVNLIWLKSFGRSGDPRMECRMWQNNLTILQMHETNSLKGVGKEKMLI